MTYSVFLERRKAKGATYRATLIGLPSCMAVGTTREEALSRLREALHRRLKEAEIVPLEVDMPKAPHPWLKFAGMFQNEPLFEEVVEDIRAYREQLGAGDAVQ